MRGSKKARPSSELIKAKLKNWNAKLDAERKRLSKEKKVGNKFKRRVRDREYLERFPEVARRNIAREIADAIIEDTKVLEVKQC
jgi:hypothetical protein